MKIASHLLALIAGMPLGALALPACAAMAPAQPTLIVEEVCDDLNVLEFQRAIRALGELCPLNAPVRVGVRRIDWPVYGMTNWNDLQGRYEIQIQAEQCRAVVIDTLIHEWAHCMVWDTVGWDDHGPLWGVARAKAYRVVLESMNSPITPPVQPADD